MARNAHNRAHSSDLILSGYSSPEQTNLSTNKYHRPSKSKPVPKASQKKAAGNNGVSGSSVLLDEEESNDEDDSSAELNEDDENEKEEAVAPSGGIVAGSEVHPIIRVDSVDQHAQAIEHAGDRGAGPTPGRLTAGPKHTPKKKRPFSGMNGTSVLHGDAESDDENSLSPTYPRKRMNRRLSNNAQNGLLAYEEVPDRRLFSVASANGQDDTAVVSDDDDDAIYAQVDSISADEADGSDIEKDEEKAIIEEELFPRRRGSSFSSTFDFAGFGDDSDPFGFNVTAESLYTTVGDAIYGDGGFAMAMIEEAAHDVFRGQSPSRPSREPSTPSDSRRPSNGSTRRVRFKDEVSELSESSSSTMSSGSSDRSALPDIFLQVDQLPVKLRSVLDTDYDEDGNTSGSDSNASYWDVNAYEEERASTGHRSAERASGESADSDSQSSGYESDYDDTTDEEEVPPIPSMNPEKTVLRKDSLSSSSDRSQTLEPFHRSTRLPKNRQQKQKAAASRTSPVVRRRKGPVMGMFNHDPSKPYGITDRHGRVQLIRPMPIWNFGNITPSAAAIIQSSPGMPYSFIAENDSDDSDPSNGSFRQPTDVMLSGISGSAGVFGDLLGGQNIGPPEAFFPAPDESIDSDDVDELMDRDAEYDDSDGEGKLNVDDFLDFGDDSSDSESDADAVAGAEDDDAAMLFSPEVNLSTPSGHHLMRHFERRGVVGSFRRNQDRSNYLAKLPQDMELRAAASKPVRHGRLAAAESPITPVRRRKSSTAKMPHSSPLNAASTARRS